jgi:archaellum component FlaC
MESDDEEYQDSEDEEREFEGYDEFEDISNKLEEAKANIEKRNSLVKEKLKLLLRFNANAEDTFSKDGNLIPGILIDPEFYRIELSRIDSQLDKIEALEEEVSSDLAQKEIEFLTLLDRYILKSKQNIKLSAQEIETIKSLEMLINELRNQYSSVSKTLEPFESVYSFDSEEYWEELEKEEIKEIKSIIKRFKLNIKIPDEEDYKKKYGTSKINIKRSYKETPDQVYLYKIKFDEAYSNFINKIAPYLPNYITRMNITTLGTTTELNKKKSIISEIKEDIEELKKLPIKLSDEDLLEIDQLNEIKFKLLELDKSKLIDCIQNSNVEIDSNYIENLRNKKIALLKYQPKNINKEPKNIKNLLISLLISLGYSDKELESKSSQELENILNEKYSIPPSLYFNKTIKYDSLLFDKHGNKIKNITTTYNSRIPLIFVKRFPVPADIKVTNERYYSSYYPVVDSLYKKLKEQGSDVSEIWALPYKYNRSSVGGSNNEKIILRKILNFEEFLSEMKILILNQISNNNQELTKISNPIKRLYIKEENDIHTDHVYQIDEYLTNKKLLPPYNLRVNKKEVGNIPGISYVANWQRKIGVRKINKILKNELISTKLEDIIYKITNNVMRSQPDRVVESYYSKINNILFILGSYPRFKSKVLTNDIKYLYHFVLFDKDLSDSLNKVQKPSIELRMSTLKQIKNALRIGTSENKRMKYSILADLILNEESKRIELLIFDINLNKLNGIVPLKASEYSNIANELSKLLMIKSFTSDIITGKIKNEQLAVLINKIKLNLNENIVKKALSKVVEIKTPEQLKLLDEEKLKDYKKLIKSSLHDTREVIYKKMNLSEIQALIDQELTKIIHLKRTGNLRELGKIENNLSKLQKVRVDKILLLNKVKKVLLKKYTSIKKVKVTEPEMNYRIINEDLLFEVVQAFKRKIILDIVKENKNKLIEILDFLDLNELNYKKGTISKDTHRRIQNILLSNIKNLIKDRNFETIENYAFTNALLQITQELEFNGFPDLTSLINNWPKKYKVQKVVVDNYGKDLFLELYKSIDPFSFYDQNIQRNYSFIVIENTKKPEEIPKVQMVLYNPVSKQFGKNAYDGYLFKVYRLEKNPNTGLPITIPTYTRIENPRLGIDKMVPIMYEKPGKTYYMKFPIINPNDPNDNFRWIEVPTGAVGMYPIDYDSCSRFINDKECNSGIGISGSKCFYDLVDNKCKAEYTKL